MLWGRRALHYSCVWEDADVLCDVLAPVAEGRRLLSISSAGDNALALLTLNPSEVVAIDLDWTQLAALELRACAFEALEHEELLGFLGVRDSSDRLAVYSRLRPGLREPARAFWDRATKAVRGGIIHCGRFERYLRWFPAILPRHLHTSLVRVAEAARREDRTRIYDEECEGLVWRTVTSLAFSHTVISIFDHRRPYFGGGASWGVRIMRERLRRALVGAPWAKSPYLTYFLTGNYSADAMPLYLRPEYHRLIRSRIGRLSLHQLDVADAATLGRFSGFNLSNVFEHVSPAVFARTYEGLLAAAEEQARLVYWSTFSFQGQQYVSTRVKQLAIAARLHEQDRVGSYESLHIDEVRTHT